MTSSEKEISFEVKQSKKFGRCCFATRHIKRGEIILKEVPLLVFPSFKGMMKSDTFGKSICTSCYLSVDNNKIVVCKFCKWPFCDMNCPEDPWHRKLECDVFRINNIFWSPERVSQLYLIRAFILKTKDPSKWKLLLDKVSSFEKKDPIRNQFISLESKNAKEFLKKCNIQVSMKEIKKLVIIFAINNFSFRLAPPERERTYGALYGKSSLFAHSCAPNTVYRPLRYETERFSIALFADVDIKKGEMLTIAYTDDYASQGTIQRRISIEKLFGFICECSRCCDPTELNTFYSSVKCEQCSEGWLNPPISKSKKFYSCDKCLHSVALKDVERIENKFKDEVREIDFKTYQVHVEQLGRLIAKAATSFHLHPNHYLVVGATERWLSSLDYKMLLGSHPETREAYETILKLAKHLLTIRRSFLMHLEQVNLEIVIATAIVRFEFKTTFECPMISESDDDMYKVAKLTAMKNHLRNCVDETNYEFCHPEVLPFLEDLEKRY